MKKIKVGMVQMAPTKSWESGMIKALAYFDKAAAKGADIMVFPEYFLGWERDIFERAVSVFRQKAAETGTNIILGSILERAGNKFYNSCVLIDRRGKVVGKHRKVHLYSPWEKFDCGKTFKIWKMNGLRIGIAICLDIYFSSDIKKMAASGADVLIIPTMTDKKEFEVHSCVARTRAVENLVPVIMVNAVGRTFIGRWQRWAGNSMIINPYGEIEGKMGDDEDYKIFELDTGKMRDARKKISCIKGFIR